MNKTISYYDDHADEFIADTLNADMRELRQRFQKYLPAGAFILDLGCGSGRDSKAFIEQGYRVEAVDGSVEMCKRAESLIKQPVHLMFFDELNADQKYDGVWACASLLHISKGHITDMIQRIERSLKPGGIFYMSVKKGDLNGERNGRIFADYQEEEIKGILTAQQFEILELNVSEDARPLREDQWINIIAKRI
jgi:SAM-dependent methyltransferase